jgi:hypothetical protein
MLLPPISRERAMPIQEIIYLSAVVAAFIVFAGVLTWAELRTRHHGA